MSGTAYRTPAEIAEDMPKPGDSWPMKIVTFGTWALIFSFFGWAFGDVHGSLNGHKEGVRDTAGACHDEVTTVYATVRCSHPNQTAKIAWYGGTTGLLCSCPRR